jgi:hypothetical protein
MDSVLKIKMLDNRCDVGCIVVHVMSIAYLARATMASAIVRYYTISLRQEKEHLVVPIISAQGPSVVEENRLSVLWAPVLEKNCHAVFCDDISMSVSEFLSGRFLS